MQPAQQYKRRGAWVLVAQQKGEATTRKARVVSIGPPSLLLPSLLFCGRRVPSINVAKKKQPFLVDFTTPRYVSAERLEAGFVHDTVANCKIMRRERSSVYGEICVCIAKGEEHKQEPGTSRDSGTRRPELGDHDYFLDCRSDTHPTAGIPPRHGFRLPSTIRKSALATESRGSHWLCAACLNEGLCVCFVCEM